MKIHRDPDSIATVFKIREKDGNKKPYVVDFDVDGLPYYEEE